MISVALQTDVSIVTPLEFVEEQTESPQAEQNEAEGTTEHCLSNNPLSPLQHNRIGANWSQLEPQLLFETERENKMSQNFA